MAARGHWVRQWSGFITKTILIWPPQGYKTILIHLQDETFTSSLPWRFWSLFMQTDQFRSLTLHDLHQEDLTAAPACGQPWAKTKEGFHIQLGADILEINILEVTQPLTGPTRGRLSVNKANFQRYHISNEIGPTQPLLHFESMKSFPVMIMPVSRLSSHSHRGSLRLLFSHIVNKFKAVVWDGVQVQNNETSALILILMGCFQKGAIWETRVVIPLRRGAKDQCPPWQCARERSAWSPWKAGSPVPTKPRLWETLFLPLEKADTSARTKLLHVCLGKWLSHWARRKIIFLGWGKR